MILGLRAKKIGAVAVLELRVPAFEFALGAIAPFAFDPEALVTIFAEPPALHRFPKAMAVRVQEVCRVLVDQYGGDAAALWRDVPSSAELFQRILALPGFGKQKAQILVALLGKQYGVQPPGWREAAGGYGEEGSYKSVADIVDAGSLGRVRAFKKAMKAAAKG